MSCSPSIDLISKNIYCHLVRSEVQSSTIAITLVLLSLEFFLLVFVIILYLHVAVYVIVPEDHPRQWQLFKALAIFYDSLPCFVPFPIYFYRFVIILLLHVSMYVMYVHGHHLYIYFLLSRSMILTFRKSSCYFVEVFYPCRPKWFPMCHVCAHM